LSIERRRFSSPLELILLEEKLKKEIPEGIIDSVKVLVRDVWTEVRGIRPWISGFLYNDGPDPAYVSINRRVPKERIEAPFNVGESYIFDMKVPKVRVIFLICDEGKKASIRMWLRR